MTDARDFEQDNGGSSRRFAGRQGNFESYGAGRGRFGGAGRRATEAIDEAPLVAIAGGLAAGALIAALLPRSRAEERVLRPVTDRVSETARAAAQAAKDAGQSRLHELGLTPERGVETIRSVIQGAGEAARASAQAALGSVKSD